MVQQFYVLGSKTGSERDIDEDDKNGLYNPLDGPVNYFPQELACIGERIFVISRENLLYFLFCLVFKAANDYEDDEDEDEASSPYMLYKPDPTYEDDYDNIEDESYYWSFSEERVSNDNLDKALEFRHAILSHFRELPNFIYINRY